MSWVMLVRVDEEWKPVRPTGGEDPYRFPDKETAARMLRISYPDQLREARLGAEPTVCIKEVDEDPNCEKYP